MSAAKHTPGPWHVDQDPRGDMAWNRSVDAADGGTVCFMAHGWGAERDEANARLIAAAPELLAAAQMARACIQLDRTALADAHTSHDGLDEDGAAGVAEYDAVLAQLDAAIAKATGSAA